MIIFDYNGQPLTQLKIVPANTATGIGSEFHTYTERTIAYTSGGTTEVVAGDWVVGATSAAKAQIVNVTLLSGTWAGGDAAGTFRIKCQHGTFQSENLNVAGNSNVATIAGNSNVLTNVDYPNIGAQAKTAMITVINNAALICVDGGNPDQTSLVGIPLTAGSTLVISDPNAIRKFKIIDYTAGSACTAHITLFF